MFVLCTVYAAAAAAVRGCDARARVRAAGAFLFIFVRAIRATDGKVFFYSQPVTMPDIPSFAGFNLGSSRSPAKGGGGKSRSNSRSNSNRQTASNRRYVSF